MKKALRVLSIATGIGVAFGLYFHLMGFTKSPVNILVSVLFSLNIGSLMMLFIYQRKFFLPKKNAAGLRILGMMLALMIAAVIGTELTRCIRDIFLLPQPFELFGQLNTIFLNILIVLVTGLPTYQHEEWKERSEAKIEKQQFELLKLEQLKTQTELEMLRAKINPHFLYNVHNTIAGLILTQPEAAEQMVLLLSKFFRFTLGKNSSTFHSVEEELEIVQTYLKIQQIRFGNRMQTEFDVDPVCIQEKVPSFLLQPLVENAVKHSIEKMPGSGIIGVRICHQNQRLVIEVSDNGPDFSDSLNYGFGLQSILNKLDLLYKKQYHFFLQSSPVKHVRIELPKKG